MALLPLERVRMKKLIIACAIFAALCLPALACGPGNPNCGNQGGQGNNQGNQGGGGGTPWRAPGRSLAPGFRSSQ